MSLIDSKLEFSAKQSLVGVTTSGTFSTNTIDLGLEENHLTGNRLGAGYLNVAFVGTDAFAPASTEVEISLQHSDDNSSYSEIMSYTVSDPNTEKSVSLKLPKALKKYIKVKYIPGATVTAGEVDAFIGVPLAEH